MKEINLCFIFVMISLVQQTASFLLLIGIREKLWFDKQVSGFNLIKSCRNVVDTDFAVVIRKVPFLITKSTL